MGGAAGCRVIRIIRRISRPVQPACPWGNSPDPMPGAILRIVGIVRGRVAQSRGGRERRCLKPFRSAGPFRTRPTAPPGGYGGAWAARTAGTAFASLHTVRESGSVQAEGDDT